MEVVGFGDFRHYQAGTSCERVRSWNGAGRYASKYMGKADDAGAESSAYAQGKSWGARGRKHLPLGELLGFVCRNPVALASGGPPLEPQNRNICAVAGVRLGVA